MTSSHSANVVFAQWQADGLPVVQDTAIWICGDHTLGFGLCGGRFH